MQSLGMHASTKCFLIENAHMFSFSLTLAPVCSAALPDRSNALLRGPGPCHQGLKAIVARSLWGMCKQAQDQTYAGPVDRPSRCNSCSGPIQTLSVSAVYCGQRQIQHLDESVDPATASPLLLLLLSMMVFSLTTPIDKGHYTSSRSGFMIRLQMSRHTTTCHMIPWPLGLMKCCSISHASFLSEYGYQLLACIA